MASITKQFQIPSAFIFITLFTISCSSVFIPKEADVSLSADFLKKQGYKYWESRGKPKHARRARYFFSIAYELKPRDVELAIAYSRACYYESLYLETDPVKKDSLFLKGSESAKKVLYRSSIAITALKPIDGDSALIEQKAIEVADESLIPALYWWAANYCQYIITKPVMERLSQRERLETILLRVLALNPNFFYGGPYRFFGTLYARLPGVELSQAKSYFDQAISTYPNYLTTKVLMAQYYHTKAGNREQFHKLLEEVINSDPTSIPEVMPENLLAQKLAKQLLDQESLLFE